MSSHSRLTWLLEMPLPPMALPGRRPSASKYPALGVRDDRSQRRLGDPPRIQEARVVGALPELGSSTVPARVSQTAIATRLNDPEQACRRAFGAFLPSDSE